MDDNRENDTLPKYPGRGNAVDNYWPISYLPLTWKLMTGIMANSVNEYLEMNT